MTGELERECAGEKPQGGRGSDSLDQKAGTLGSEASSLAVWRAPQSVGEVRVGGEGGRKGSQFHWCLGSINSQGNTVPQQPENSTLLGSSEWVAMRNAGMTAHFLRRQKAGNDRGLWSLAHKIRVSSKPNST